MTRRIPSSVSFYARRAARQRAKDRPTHVFAFAVFVLVAAVFGTAGVLIAANPNPYAPMGEQVAACGLALIIAGLSVVGALWAAWSARP